MCHVPYPSQYQVWGLGGDWRVQVAYLVSLLLEESYLVRILGGETNLVVFHDKTNQFGNNQVG